MKKFLILLPLLFSLTGCPGALVPTDQTAAPIVSAQKAAEQSLYAAGAALQAAPKIMQALYDAGKMSKTDYNNAVPVYNQALASFNAAVNALKAAVNIGADPTKIANYDAALTTFLGDAKAVNDLITALGGAK
jgi:hypothetical protein